MTPDSKQKSEQVKLYFKCGECLQSSVACFLHGTSALPALPVHGLHNFRGATLDVTLLVTSFTSQQALQLLPEDHDPWISQNCETRGLHLRLFSEALLPKTSSVFNYFCHQGKTPVSHPSVMVFGLSTCQSSSHKKSIWMWTSEVQTMTSCSHQTVWRVGGPAHRTPFASSSHLSIRSIKKSVSGKCNWLL